MTEDLRTYLRRIFHTAGTLFLVFSIAALSVLFFYGQRHDLDETYQLADETTLLLKEECQKFDNYKRGNNSAELQSLLDAAKGLKDFIPSTVAADSEFLQTFIRTEHVSGVIILDGSLSVVAAADMDNNDAASLWKDVLERDFIKDIISHPQKSYIDNITLSDVPYNFAAVASDDSDRLILCYSSTVKPSSDPYEYNISDILKNNNFHKDPTVVITNGSELLSTNSDDLQASGIEQYEQINDSIDWNSDKLVSFNCNGDTWYGVRRVFKNYFIYAVYPSAEIFSTRSNTLLYGFMLYMIVFIIYLVIHRRIDRANIYKMEKQLRIIDAISTSYSSTFLLHLDTDTLEPLKPSDKLRSVFKLHPEPHDFLSYLCSNCVEPKFRNAVMNFMDFDTIAERLKGKQFMGIEAKDISETWYSVLIIPQKYGADGSILAVLVTTRDITDIKQTEELSFRDKLTGLHNRNYMESRSSNFARSGDLPVSLIMADCNYLKRTNDTLGHEYGDILLQRTAAAINESIPENSIAMRAGGDEFIVFCPKCSSEKAHEIIDHIRLKLKEKSDATLTLSASFGVYTAESGGISFKEAYDMADRDMYRDKQAHHAGRS